MDIIKEKGKQIDRTRVIEKCSLSEIKKNMLKRNYLELLCKRDLSKRKTICKNSFGMNSNHLRVKRSLTTARNEAEAKKSNIAFYNAILDGIENFFIPNYFYYRYN